MKYCEDCRQDSWPKHGQSYNYWGRCDVCGTMKYCYNGPDALRREVKPTREDWNKPVEVEQTEAEQATAAVREATRLPYTPTRVLG